MNREAATGLSSRDDEPQRYRCGSAMADHPALRDGNAQHELSRRRDAIDALDRELLKLLNERARQAQAIGTLKGGGAHTAPSARRRCCARSQSDNPGRCRTKRWPAYSGR